MKIRAKLLLLCMVMLSIPYVGFQYLRETERYLQSSLEESLTSVSAAMATAMQFQSSIFTNSIDDLSIHGGLFVHQLSYPIHVDGYAEEWLDFAEWSERFKLITTGRPGAYESSLDGFSLVLGEHGQYLYALLVVNDAEIRYAESEDPFELADRLEMVVQNSDGEIQSLVFSPVGPGKLSAYRIVEEWDFTYSIKPVTNVVAALQETEQGYTVEIKIPSQAVGNFLGFIVHDGVGMAQKERTEHPLQPLFIAATNDVQTRKRPSRILRTSAKLRQMIERVGLKPGQRVWVLNRTGQVLASGGSLMSERKTGAINLLYTWILPEPADSFEDDLRSASRLQGQEVLAALSGKSASRWRSSPDERAVIVSAAHPVRAGNELVGAVVIEETTNSIQTLQRDAMASLYNKSILVICIATAVIMLFASRLSYRILKLKSTADRAIDEHGRIIGEVPLSSAADEIGDLSRSFTAMTNRLGEYHSYLEGMASKLSHELRTPISVVSSSLDNLQNQALDENAERYVGRARDGINRLQGLLLRLSEAARLEQSITEVENTRVDLLALLESLSSSYAETYSEHRFEFDPAVGEAHVLGSADLVAQMMDKLIANAVEFCDNKNEPITLALQRIDSNFEISVTNKGPTLPAELQEAIFNSMISVRDKKSTTGAHLGLGLYIVRLISEHHGGRVAAENLPDGSGVRFTVLIPEAEMVGA